MDINTVFKKYDPKSECEWREWNDAKFLIAPMDNPYQKKEATKHFTLAETLSMETQGPEALKGMAADSIKRMYGLYAASLVFDWENVKDGKKDLKFDVNKVHEWMVEFDDFANFVIRSSVEIRDKRNEETEAIAKNSESL